MRQMMLIGAITPVLARAIFMADVDGGGGAQGAQSAQGAQGAQGAQAAAPPSDLAAAFDSMGSAIESLKGDVDDLKTEVGAAASAADLKALTDRVGKLETSSSALGDKLAALIEAQDGTAARLKQVTDADLDDRVKKLESVAASGGSTSGFSVKDYLKDAEMSAEALVARVEHLWKQNGNAT